MVWLEPRSLNCGRCSSTLSEWARQYVDPESNIASQSEIIWLLIADDFLRSRQKVDTLNYGVSTNLIIIKNYDNHRFRHPPGTKG